MRFMKYFQMSDKPSAQLAKNRLHIIIAQERTQHNGPDFLQLLRQDILAAIAKHTNADIDQVTVDLSCRDNNSVLELNVVLPDQQTQKVKNEQAEPIV